LGEKANLISDHALEGVADIDVEVAFGVKPDLTARCAACMVARASIRVGRMWRP
jgi:hypothetical protein